MHNVFHVGEECKETLIANRLDTFSIFLCLAPQGRSFTIGTELMKNVEDEDITEDRPFYTFNGFNVSKTVSYLPHTFLGSTVAPQFLLLYSHLITDFLLSPSSCCSDDFWPIFLNQWRIVLYY